MNKSIPSCGLFKTCPSRNISHFILVTKCFSQVRTRKQTSKVCKISKSLLDDLVEAAAASADEVERPLPKE